jgi:hypothetical protein
MIKAGIYLFAPASGTIADVEASIPRHIRCLRQGAGAAIMFAMLLNKPALTNADFGVI